MGFDRGVHGPQPENDYLSGSHITTRLESLKAS
jgi:hypothetical protein